MTSLLDRPLVYAIPERLTAESFWVEHIPFAFWLVDAARPGMVVELGTHAGDSYCAFCQAVSVLGYPARCHAIDTWAGDIHTGPYARAVLDDLRAHHDPRYGSFSRLNPTTFDGALDSFPDGSIDLLHIDGTHTYEAARHDFEAWEEKVSQRGIVLLHDTNVRQAGFGVRRLWDELRDRHPSFEFQHGAGLGVLAVGAEVPTPVGSLLQKCRDPLNAGITRRFFAAMGHRACLMRDLLVERARAAELHKGLQERDGADRQRDKQQEIQQGVARLETLTVAQDERAVEILLRVKALQDAIGMRPDDAARLQDYLQLVRRVRALVREQTPPGAAVLVISRGDDAIVDLPGRRASHFPQDADGCYAGYHPGSAAEAVEQLDRLSTSGAGFLVIPSTASWWFDHYPQFRDHVNTRYRLRCRVSSVCDIFDLRPEPNHA